MSLLGWPLVAVLATIALALPVATYLLWSRWRGPRVVRAGARFALLGLSQLSAVLLVAALINNYGYFYGSWGELVGSAPNIPNYARVAPEKVRAGGKVGQRGTQPDPVTAKAIGATISSLPDIGWSTQAEWPTRGRVESVNISGSRSSLSSNALIYFPPQYFQPRYAHARFPVTEILTGFPGLDLEMVYRIAFPDKLLTEMAAKRAQPMVFVMLSPTLVRPRDTECTDVPGGPQVETFLAEDLPAAIRSAYRVLPLGWGVMGASTGGYCAAKIAFNHSDVFTAAVSLSGYYHTLKDNTTGDLWGGSSVLRKLNDPEWRLAHQPAPPVSMLVTISKQELGSTGYVDTQRFLSLVRNPLLVDSIIVPTGGHNYESIGVVVPQALDWLSAHLGGPV
jgi:hypothetical protein